MIKTIADLTSFSDATTVPVADFPRPDRLVTGVPERKTWNHYRSADGLVDSGVWECQPGAWKVFYPEDQEELCVLQAGHMRLHDSQGGYKEFKAGDAFVIPGGFIGVWETLVTVRKFYLITKRA